MKYLDFKENNLLLINFDEVFKEIETDCLTELDKYGLIEDYKIKLSKRDTKKIIYHCIIHGLCEEIRNNPNKQNKVIVIPPSIRDFHEITEFCEIEDLEKILKVLFKKLSNSLPFFIYFANDFIFDEELEEGGETKDMICMINAMCNDISNKNFTFEKIKKFSKRFELEFLSKEYFNCIKTKLLLS